MTCSDFRNLFSDYLEGQVHATLRREFEAHVQGCAECASGLRRVREVRQRLARLERKRLPDTFSFTIRRMLLEEVRRERAWMHRVRNVLWPTPQMAWSAAVGTAAAVICFSVLWAIWTPGTSVERLRNRAVAGRDSITQKQSVRYVLEHLPLEGDLIESTANDTASRSSKELAPPAAAQPVSSTF